MENLQDLQLQLKKNTEKQRKLYLQTCAYEHKLKKVVDPDSPEWEEIYHKLEELDGEGDRVFMERCHLKEKLRSAAILC